MKKYLVFTLGLFIAFNLTALESGGPYTADTNTVFLMHFEDNVINSASGGQDGVIYGDVTFEASRDGLGKCARINNLLSSSESAIIVPFYEELNFSDEFSIEFWFKIDSWDADHNNKPRLLRKYSSGLADYELLLSKEHAVLQANVDCIDETDYTRDISTRTNDIIETDKWYHIAIYFNYFQHYLYLILRDENYEELVASRSYTFTRPNNTSGLLKIGCGNYSNSFFDGCIDEIRISKCVREYRDDIISDINETSFADSIPPLLKDKWKVYQPPFNAYYPLNSVSGKQYAGADCGETAMLRIIHYWEYPRFPEGYLDYTADNYHWTADYNNAEYRYDQMPYVFAASPEEDDYRAAATLAMHIAAPKNYYLIGYNGRNPYMPGIFEKYFLFDTNTRFVFREEYSKDEWIKIFKNELNNGRPILLCGNEERFDNGGVAGHFYICDAYKGDKFHTDLSIGSTEYWVDIDDFPYGNNQEALIFARPAWEGRSLTLDYPKGDEYFRKGSAIDISWSCENITSVMLEYSTDAGKTWQLIADNIPAANAAYSWTLPDITSSDYKIRVSNKDDMNIYERSGKFNVFNELSFDFQYPLAGNCFQAGCVQPLYWTSEGIPMVRFEYSTDQSNWTLLKDSIACSSGMTRCIMPDVNSGQVTLRAVDLNDQDNIFNSDMFSISNQAPIGGAYKKEDNAIVLMHFDGDLSNLCTEPQAGYSTGENYSENYELSLGKAFLIDNGPDASYNCLTIPDCDGLDLGNQWSLNFWIKYRNYGTDKTKYPFIFNKDGVMTLGLRGSGYIKADLTFASTQALSISQSAPLLPNAWYHIELDSDADAQTVSMQIHDATRNLVFEQSKAFPSGSSGILASTDNDIHIGGVDMGSNIQFDGWIDELMITKGEASGSAIASIPEFMTLRSYPNPFNNSCTFEYDLPRSSLVNLDIIDLNGRVVMRLVDGFQQAGEHKIRQEFNTLVSGLYFYRLKASDRQITKKMLFLK